MSTQSQSQSVLLLLVLLWCMARSLQAKLIYLHPRGLDTDTDLFMLMNEDDGFYQGDYFNILSFRHTFVDIYINNRKLRPSRFVHQDAKDTMFDIMHAAQETQCYMSEYAFPNLVGGLHNVTIYASTTLDCNTNQNVGVRRLNMTLHCESHELMFPITYTSVCNIDRSSITYEHDPDVDHLE